MGAIVGVVGGTGGMGRLFAEFFKRHDYDVIISSRRTDITPEKCAEMSDILIITVPIADTIDVIKRLAPLVKKDGLIMDLTSLKSREVETMMTYSVCEVLGCHPVFGPSVTTFENQVVVLTPGRGDYWLPKISALMNEEKAIVKISTPEKHDEIMSIVQGLMHLTTITFVDTLLNLNADINEINNYSSPVYRIRSDFANRILNQNPELYADISLNNPSTLVVMEKYLTAVNDMISIVTHKDRECLLRNLKNAQTILEKVKKSRKKEQIK